MIYTYLLVFVVNPLLCVVTLWLLFKLCLHRLLKRLSSKRIDGLFKKLLPPEEIATELVPVAEEIKDMLPKIVPGWIKFLGKSWYRKVKGLVKSMNDKEKLQEFIEVVLEETKLTQIIKKNMEKRNPGVVQGLLTSAFPPWIIVATGLLLGVLIGIVQLIVLKI